MVSRAVCQVDPKSKRSRRLKLGRGIADQLAAHIELQSLDSDDLLFSAPTAVAPRLVPKALLR